MRITVEGDLDLAVASGTTVPEILEAARGLGVALGPVVWCGDVSLDPQHPAGTWPLLEGAHLTSAPGLPCAPPNGPTALVVAGPHTGARASIGAPGVLIGRGDLADLALRDPTVSRSHARVTGGRLLTVSDLGSSNGTVRWRGASSKTIGRQAEVKGGDVLALGESLVAILDGADDGAGGKDALAETPRVGLSARLAPLAGSIMSGMLVAAMTGRWYLALLGLTYPAYTLVSIGILRLRPTCAPWDLGVLPSLLPVSRRAWATAAPRSIAIVGEESLAKAFARALALTLGRQPQADSWREPWMRWLPLATPTDPEVIIIPRAPAPSWCDSRVEVGPHGGLIWLHGRATPIPPIMVAEPEADAFARSLAGESGTTSLPRQVRWADIADRLPSERSRPRTLTVPIGATASGSFLLDLDAHGPHLLVAGTTGSGKSALLETLLLGLALRYPPEDLGVALIDFKGGAGIRTCLGLPHVRGVLTDLDPHLARRALGALARELEDRKAALATVGLSSFREWEALGEAPARLLVIADEYQEVAAQYREFLPDLARLAAQGRSLGLHLILATQRPSGAVTPEIRANVGTTFALRVVTDSESHDLIGTADAAGIPVDAPGRAIALTGTHRTLLQVALPCVAPTPRIRPWGEVDDLTEASSDMAAQVAERWADREKAPPLWLDPLPLDLGDSFVRDAGLSPAERSAGLWLGRGDLPADRRQPDIIWDPRSGPILIAGPPRSGRTTALRLLAFQAGSHHLRPVWLPSDPREAARTIALFDRTPDCLLLVDDAQNVIAQLADIDRGAAVDRLLGLASSGASLAIVLPKGGHHRLASYGVAFLVFASGDPTDDAAWSMPRSLHGLPPRPGRARFGTAGTWCECQVGRMVDAVSEPLVTPLPLSLTWESLPAADGFVIGIGGDDAAPVSIDPGHPIVVVGPPGPFRDAIESSLSVAAFARGVTLDIGVVEIQMGMPRSVPPEATVILVEPTDRTARDLFRGDLSGLIDPRPSARRVLVIAAGKAVTCQIADPPAGGRVDPDSLGEAQAVSP